MSTQTTKVARKIMAKSGMGHTLFNDRLKDGRRSLKVWGWPDKLYEKAAKKLNKLGCKAEVVHVRSSNGYYKKDVMVTRLHVTEPSE